MNLPAVLTALRWFTRDTFRQAWASRLSWLMLGVSVSFIIVCLSVGIHGAVDLNRGGELHDFLPANDVLAPVAQSSNQGVEVLGGELTIFFGLIRVPLGRDAEDAVRFLHLLLAGGVADTLGILLALIWTAGFLPGFLEPDSVPVLLAKPVPRWALLLGKYLGVLAFVGFQAAVFVVGTWIALGLRTDIWHGAYLLCVPLLLVHFSIFFGFSALLAVCTRSTVLCVFGSVLFWLMCWGMNYGRHVAVLLPEGSGTSSAAVALADAGYWLLPKPADLGYILFDALQAGKSFRAPEAFQALTARGTFYPLLSVLTSLAFALCTLAAAAWEFARTDY